jgi:pimeloyl-ACP methyl ester carboxylesterase
MAQSVLVHPEKSTTGRSDNGTDLRLAALRAGYGLAAATVPGLADRFAAERFLTPRRTKRVEAEDDILSSARTLELSAPGLGVSKIAAWAWGHGPPVVLVHGWEGRGSQLGGFVEPLVMRGFTAVAFDAPAHGDSPGRRASLRSFVAAIDAVRVRFGEPYGIVSHSFGSLASLLALAQGLPAKSAVVIAPPSPRERLAWLGRLLGADADRVRAVGARVAEVVGLTVDEVEAPVLARRISTPGLVIHDLRDREIPYAYGRALAAAWPHARLLTTDGLGHRRILRDPEVIAQSVRFLTAHAPELPASGDLSRWLDLQAASMDFAPPAPTIA